MRRKLAAGNWKMHGTAAALGEVDTLKEAFPAPGCEILICPPATLIERMARRAAGSAVMVGGQDCHWQESGAHTGDISAAMLKDAGAGHVILGHSERRADHCESDETVRAKAKAAQGAGLVAIICCGESLETREAGGTLSHVGSQIAGSLPDGCTGENTVVAYEPIWAIGTGKVPTLGEIGEVHDFIRAELVARFGEEAGSAIRLLYGGSVKPANAASIFAVSNVDGALVGGASLKAGDFGAIISALEEA